MFDKKKAGFLLVTLSSETNLKDAHVAGKDRVPRIVVFCWDKVVYATHGLSPSSQLLSRHCQAPADQCNRHGLILGFGTQDTKRAGDTEASSYS